MRPLLAAALIGLATYGAYALLVRPETAALMRSLSASADREAAPAPDDLGVQSVEAAGGVAEERAEAAPAPAPSNAVETIIGSETYAVQGDTEQEILNSLRLGGPKSAGAVYFGLTVTELEYQYYKVEEIGACRIEDVTVELRVDITLPDWTPGRDADARLRSAWARFSAALTGHENHHRDLAVEGAEEVRAGLEGLRVPDCASADAEARRVAEAVRIRTETRHRDFDHQTGHGREQGAVWPQP